MQKFRYIVHAAGSGVLAATMLDGGDASRRPGCVSRRGRHRRRVHRRAARRRGAHRLLLRPRGDPAGDSDRRDGRLGSRAPTGRTGRSAVEEAVNATVAELFACFDAGQYARAFALMTDDMARQFGPDVNNPDEDTPEEVRALLEAQLAGTPVADEPGMEQGASMDVGRGRDVRTLEGGRVGGVWTIEGDAVFFVLEQQDDRWVVDEVIDIVEDNASASGTPTS